MTVTTDKQMLHWLREESTGSKTATVEADKLAAKIIANALQPENETPKYQSRSKSWVANNAPKARKVTEVSGTVSDIADSIVDPSNNTIAATERLQGAVESGRITDNKAISYINNALETLAGKGR